MRQELMRALNERVRNWCLAPPNVKVTRLYFSPKVTDPERLYGVKIMKIRAIENHPYLGTFNVVIYHLNSTELVDGVVRVVLLPLPVFPFKMSRLIIFQWRHFLWSPAPFFMAAQVLAPRARPQVPMWWYTRERNNICPPGISPPPPPPHHTFIPKCQ